MAADPQHQSSRRRRYRPNLGRWFAVGASLLSLFVYWYHLPLLDQLDILSRDMVFQLHQAPAPPPEVIVVAVDEKSVKQYGRWPWPRAVQADLLARLKQLNASVIALDIIYLRPQDPQQDRALASALALPGGPIVGGYFFRDEQSFPNTEAAIALLKESRIRKVLEAPGARHDKVPTFPYVETNQPDIAVQVSGVGFFNYIPDVDGMVRSASLVLGYGQDYYPSLALAALARKLDGGIELTFTPEGIGTVRVGDRRIPVDGSGRMVLNFYNGPQQIPILSAADVLDGRLGPENIAGRMVFVGVTELGIADVRPTPVDPSFPGVAVHATVAANVLQGFYLYQDNQTILINVGLMALLPLIMVWIMSRLRSMVFMTSVFLATAGLVWGIFYWTVTTSGLLISFAYPLVAVLLGYLVFQTYHILVTQRHSRFLRTAFSTYVAPALVDRLVRNPDALTLTGEKRTISVLFSDIRGFTTLSETLPAEPLVQLLNRYLAPMTAIVMEENGTLDKYIGDAVMAIFNAPLDVPDHAQRAVRSACRMLQTLEQINREFLQDYEVRLDIGVGIHTGEAVVGNMGSDKRFDYTAIGDTVNLASRLEGRTKAYGVSIVLSQSTHAELGDQFLCRKLDRVRVKGKHQPVEIYEVVTEPSTPEVQALITRFHEALEHYFAGEFGEALERFLAIKQDFPDDKPTQLFVDRCGFYLEMPPEPDWGGVFVAIDK